MWGGEPAYSRATYEVDKYKRRLARLRKTANRLSLEIDRANFNSYIEIDREKNFDPGEFVDLG